MSLYKCIYLGSKNHRLNDIPFVDFTYNDIDSKCNPDLLCDMLDVAIDDYDLVIATPPCNWYSHANWRRNESKVALDTKHLLPDILFKLKQYSYELKPWLVENVRNWNKVPHDDGCFVYFFGNHTFWSNVPMMCPDESYSIRQNKQNLSYGYRDGNYNVDFFIRYWLYEVLHRWIPTLRFDKRFMPSKKAT